MTHTCNICGERKAQDEMHRVQVQSPHVDGTYHGVCIVCNAKLKHNPFHYVPVEDQAKLYETIVHAWAYLMGCGDDAVGADMSDFLEEAKNAIFLMREAGKLTL